MSDFTFWSEPEQVWVRDGVQLIVGGGEELGAEKAFLAIETENSTSYVALSPRALDELLSALVGISKAMGEAS